MGSILRSELLAWYTKLNNGYAKAGLSVVAPNPSSLNTESSVILGNTGKTLRAHLNSLQSQYNFTGTQKCTLADSEFDGDLIRSTLKSKIDAVIASIDSVNVAAVGYSQSTNSDGVNSNVAHSNGEYSNGDNGNGVYSNGANSNIYNSLNGYTNGKRINGVNGNVTCQYGTCTNGANSLGTNSNGVNSNGCTESSNTRETTYSNT